MLPQISHLATMIIATTKKSQGLISLLPRGESENCFYVYVFL